MPLTEAGRQVLANMINTYGADKGRAVFYASIKKKVKGSDKWHEKTK